MPLPINPPPSDLAELPHWVVWRSELRMGKKTKIPYDPAKWQRASSTDPKTWGTLESATNAADRFDGIGFCFSKDDPFAGVDLDDCINEAGVMEPWAKEIVHRLDSYTEVSPSGKGVKIFLKGELPVGSRKRTGRVEMYDRERYFTFTGRAFNGSPNTIQDRREELLAVYKIVFEPDAPAVPAPAASTASPTPRAPLQLADADLIERAKASYNGYAFDLLWRGDVSHHNDDRSAADLALCDHLAFWCGPDPTRIERLFGQSGLNREKWEKRADYRRRTIDKALAGKTEFYEPPADHGAINPEVVASIADLIAGKPPVIETEPDPQTFGEQVAYLPADLRRPPGVIGDVCDWMNATAIKQQPVLAVANALAFFGAVVGRKVRTPTDLRTNLYCLGVGASGCGKDHSRKAVKRICEAAGLTATLLGGEEVSSDAAILASVHMRPSVLFQFDEIGHFLANANSKYAATHLRGIAPTFTKLFSSANTTLIGKEYAGRDNPRKDVVQPNVCLYGTTVPERLYEGMSVSEITDGFLGRMMVFQSDDSDPIDRDAVASEPPESVVTAVTAWANRRDMPQAKGNIAAVVQHTPITVPFDPEAVSVFNRFRAACRERKTEHRGDNGLDVLWTRALEHARKVALVVACGCATVHADGTISPTVVRGDVADWSVRLVDHLVKSLVTSVRDSVSGSDFERDLLYVQRAIRNAGPAGIAKTQLIHRTRRLTPRVRQETLNQLVTTAQVVVIEKKGLKGPSATTYIAKSTTVVSDPPLS